MAKRTDRRRKRLYITLLCLATVVVLTILVPPPPGLPYALGQAWFDLHHTMGWLPHFRSAIPRPVAISLPIAFIAAIGIFYRYRHRIRLFRSLLIPSWISIPHLKNISNSQSFDDQGWIYILSSPSHAYLKVGFTGRTPEERAKELRTTGMPYPFKVEWAMPHRHARRVEKQTHRLLGALMIDPKHEFTSATLRLVITTVKKAAKQIDHTV